MNQDIKKTFLKYELVLEKLKTKFKTVIINNISPSIGTHSGPGALGIMYYGNLKPSDSE